MLHKYSSNVIHKYITNYILYMYTFELKQYSHVEPQTIGHPSKTYSQDRVSHKKRKPFLNPIVFRVFEYSRQFLWGLHRMHYNEMCYFGWETQFSNKMLLLAICVTPSLGLNSRSVVADLVMKWNIPEVRCVSGVSRRNATGWNLSTMLRPASLIHTAWPGKWLTVERLKVTEILSFDKDSLICVNCVICWQRSKLEKESIALKSEPKMLMK